MRHKYASILGRGSFGAWCVARTCGTLRAMKTSLAWLVVAFSAAASLALEPAAAAQASDADKAIARELYNDGVKALEAEHFAVAAAKFQNAVELFHAPTMLIGLARAYIGLGKFVEAKETYNRVLNEKLPANASDAFLQAQKDAAKEIRSLDEKIGSATIAVKAKSGALPAGLVATLDGQELKQAAFGMKRPMNPGSHELRVTAPDFADATQRFDVTARKDVAINVALTKVEAAGPTGEGAVRGGGGSSGEPTATTTNEATGVLVVPPAGDDPKGGSTQATLGWATLGLGGAGLVLGGITGGLALSKHASLEESCPTGQCGAGFNDKISSYETLGMLSTVGFIAGGALGAAGIVLLVTAPTTPVGEKASAFVPISFGVGPGSVRATFEF